MFFGKFVELCSLETPVFEIHPSALLPTNGGRVIRFSILPLYKHSLVGTVSPNWRLDLIKNLCGNKSSKLVFYYYLYHFIILVAQHWAICEENSLLRCQLLNFLTFLNQGLPAEFLRGFNWQSNGTSATRQSSCFNHQFICFNHKTQLNNKVFKHIWCECIYFCFLFGKI